MKVKGTPCRVRGGRKTMGKRELRHLVKKMSIFAGACYRPKVGESEKNLESVIHPNVWTENPGERETSAAQPSGENRETNTGRGSPRRRSRHRHNARVGKKNPHLVIKWESLRGWGIGGEAPQLGGGERES